jgi:hypothetical protein
VPCPRPPARDHSGFNLRKLEEQLALGRIHARYRKPETFRRIPGALLARALSEGGVDFLLLDLRPSDEYDACHVTQGTHASMSSACACKHAR